MNATVRAVVISAVVLGTIGVLAWAWSGEQPAVADPSGSVPSRAPSGGSAPQAAAAQPGEAGPCRFVQGSGATFAGSMTLRGMVRSAAFYATIMTGTPGTGPEQKADEIDTAATWQLHTRVVRADADGGAVLAAQLVDLKGRDLPAGDASPVFLVQLDRRCHVERFAWNRSADVAGARVQQGYLSLADFSLPEPLQPGASSGNGVDERGKFAYRMVVGQVDGGLTLVRRKTSYAAVGSQSGQQVLAQGVGGDGLEVRLAPGRWFDSAKLREQVTMGPPDGVLSRVSVEADVRRTDQQPPQLSANPSDKDWVWGNLLLEPAGQFRSDSKDDPSLAGVSFDDLQKRLSELDRQGKGGPESVVLMAAWLRANPGAVPQVEAWLRKEGAKDDATKNTARRWLEALGRSGVPAARATLRSLANDPQFYGPLRADAALAMVGAKGFAKEDMAALLQLSRERPAANESNNLAGYPAAAGMALMGAAAHDVQKTQPELAQQAIDELKQVLQGEQDKQFVKAALLGAGNTGDPSMLASLQPYITHADVDYRYTAASALRLMPADQLAAIFVARMAAETHDNVTEQLAHSMWVQTFQSQKAPADDVVAAAIAQYNGAHSSAVEAELTKLLAEAAAHSAAAKQALIARFQAELAKGAGGDSHIMHVIGMYLSTADLQGGH